MRKGVFEFLMVMLISLLFLVPVGFYLFNIQPKIQELDALKFGPGGIVELTNQRDSDKAYVSNVKNYEKRFNEAKKELSKLKEAKK